ncbi:MAG: Ribonuclease BN [Polaribacter sejongensis]|nr:MAG: Ribonuclease BN [Polaribacter sejongensis]
MVKQLVIGHYSGRYKDISVFKKEAQEIFENTALAEPGKIFSVNE